MARDTKLGQEEITRDIPNVGEEALKNLDEAGIVYIGAEVKPGDILVGKVTPKGESPMTPGGKAACARSLAKRRPTCATPRCACRPGVSGTIVEVRVFSRRGVDKDERALAIERAEIERLAKDRDDERAILERSFAARLKELLLGPDRGRRPERHEVRGPSSPRRCLAEYTAVAVAADLGARRRPHGRYRGAEEADGRRHRRADRALREQGREAAARRRAAARRDEDGQGLRRGEAQAAAGRQDGRPARQQGRHLAHRAGRGHALSRRRHAGRHRAQPARRAEPHECRADPRNPSRLGLGRARPADRRGAGARSGAVPAAATGELRQAPRRILPGAGEVRDRGAGRRRAGRARRQSRARRADGEPGLRRRARGRHRRDAGEGRARARRAR